MITSLAGGVGAARFLRGLRIARPQDQLCVVGNTGDDFVLHGLSISPDLDTLTYSLAGAANTATGWGRNEETWRAMSSLEHLGGQSWFALGDLDLGTHLYRTQRLGEGASLSEVTAEIARAWNLNLELLPMSNHPVHTKMHLTSGNVIDFQDYFVRHRHQVAVEDVTFEGSRLAKAAPKVLDALQKSDAIIICPSNPVVSIGPILSIGEISEVVKARRDYCAAISPIIAGAAIKGPAAHLMAELGEQASVVGVAKRYASFASVLVIDEADAHLAQAVEDQGMRCVVVPTVMASDAKAASLANSALDALGL